MGVNIEVHGVGVVGTSLMASVPPHPLSHVARGTGLGGKWGKPSPGLHRLLNMGNLRVAVPPRSAPRPAAPGGWPCANQRGVRGGLSDKVTQG